MVFSPRFFRSIYSGIIGIISTTDASINKTVLISFLRILVRKSSIMPSQIVNQCKINYNYDLFIWNLKMCAQKCTHTRIRERRCRYITHLTKHIWLPRFSMFRIVYTHYSYAYRRLCILTMKQFSIKYSDIFVQNYRFHLFNTLKMVTL